MSLLCGCVMASAEKKSNTDVKGKNTKSSDVVIFTFLQSLQGSHAVAGSLNVPRKPSCCLLLLYCGDACREAWHVSAGFHRCARRGSAWSVRCVENLAARVTDRAHEDPLRVEMDPHDGLRWDQLELERRPLPAGDAQSVNRMMSRCFFILIFSFCSHS